MVDKLAFQFAFQCVAQFAFRVDFAEAMEQFGGQFGQFQLLDFQHLELSREIRLRGCKEEARVLHAIIEDESLPKDISRAVIFGLDLM